MRARALALLLAAATTGCFKPAEVDEGLLCGDENDFKCPEGQTCDPTGVCRWGDDDDYLDAAVPAPDASTSAVDASPGADAFDIANCEHALPCPGPTGDAVTVCGRIYDMQYSSEIREDGADGLPCSGSESEGPCALQILFYDPLAYSSDPDVAPIEPGSLTVDSCGRFAATDIPRPAIGLLSTHVDDAPDRGLDGFVATAYTYPVEPADPISGSFALATTKALDQQWTTTAGDPFGGSTFSEVGVSVHLFLYQSAPRRDVTVVVGGSEVPDDDYYFNDGDPYSRNTIEPLGTMTGVNGTALVVNASAATNHGGSGGEPDGCEWLQQLTGSVPGLVHYVEHIAVTSGTEDECP